MMTLTLQETGYRQVVDLMGRRVELSQAEMDGLVETSGRRLTFFLREEAPKGLADDIQGSGLQRLASGGSFYDISLGGDHGWLLPMLLQGTQPHEIPKGGSAAQLAKGYPLRFYWENGPDGPGIYYYWSVHHPGAQPNPFIGRAIDRWRSGEADDAMQALGVSIVVAR